jgi:CBS domain containing-hemolysin-like protein
MAALLIVLILLLSVVLVVVSFVHLLYRETLRLRPKEQPALEYFKEHLEDRLGSPGEGGALTYSLMRHSLLLLMSMLAYAAAAASGGPAWRVWLEAILFGWLGMVLAAHFVPHMLYRRTSAAWVEPWVPALRVLCFLARPPLGVLSFLQSLGHMGNGEESPDDAGTPVENIEALISAGAEEGLIEEGDRKLIESVVAFGDKRVREVMTSRTNIVAIAADATLEALRRLVIHEQYSRIPVYEGSIEQIIGFVHVRDMFEREYLERSIKQVRDVMRSVRFVPETKLVTELLQEMRQDGSHLVIVVDEFGRTAGLATLEDLVEEIVGEIRDEHEPGQDCTREPDGSYVMAGSFDVDHLREILDYTPPEGIEANTVGGLAAEWLGHVPRPGEYAERDGIRIQVLAASERRVDSVRVSRLSGNPHAAERI